MKLYSALYHEFYPFHGFTNLFGGMAAIHHPEEMTDPGALVIWGGADIHPSFYGQPNTHSHVGPHPSRRDMDEWNLMGGAIERGIPVIGICRGAQMLCARAGGTLVQHVDGHGGNHIVVTNDEKEFRVNSLHHQMMNPFGVKHEMIAWTKEKVAKKFLDSNGDVEIPCEPEMVYFPEIKGIAIQWHPEMMGDQSDATLYIQEWMVKNVAN